MQCHVSVSPQNTVTVAAAETRLVVDSLVSYDLFHLIYSFPTLDADVLHHCSGSNLSTWMNEWMNEWMNVFAPSYRGLSRGCCMSIICLLIQFSFKSTTETSKCKARVANSKWKRVPDRRAGSGEATWSISRQSTAWNCQIVTGSRTEMLTTSCRRHRSAHVC